MQRSTSSPSTDFRKSFKNLHYEKRIRSFDGFGTRFGRDHCPIVSFKTRASLTPARTICFSITGIALRA